MTDTSPNKTLQLFYAALMVDAASNFEHFGVAAQVTEKKAREQVLEEGDLDGGQPFGMTGGDGMALVGQLVVTDQGVIGHDAPLGGNPKLETRNSKQTRNPKSQTKNSEFLFRSFLLRYSDLFRISSFGFRIF